LTVDTSTSAIAAYPATSSLPAVTAPSAAVVHPSEKAAEASAESEAAASTVTVVAPRPGMPILQSARLIVNEAALNIPRHITQRVNTLLQDLGAPEHPLPTRVVCDLYDQVRQEAVALAALQSAISRRERELAAYRAVEKNSSAYESFSRDIVLPHGAMLYKLPHAHEALPVASASSSQPPPSPQRMQILNPHEYADLIGTLGIALLSVDVSTLGESDGTTAATGSTVATAAASGKKVAKRKSTGSEGGMDGDATKKPPAKRSRPKIKTEGGMDAQAIAAAAAAAVAGGILNTAPE
jgi:hypothetical protein